MYKNTYYVREDLETPILTEIDAVKFNEYLYCFNKLRMVNRNAFPGTIAAIFYDENDNIVAMRKTEKLKITLDK